jgi:hypothetical protein
MSETRQTLAIESLVRRRCMELGLSQPELTRCCGYKNISKGLRRLDQLYWGDFKSSAGLIAKLPAALDVPVDVIKKAVEETPRFLHESEEAAWRAAFTPHAVILAERERPQPLFVAALIGVDVLLRIDFDLTAEPATFQNQALDGGTVVFRLSVGLSGSLSITARIALVEDFDRAYRLGFAQFSIGRHAISFSGD